MKTSDPLNLFSQMKRVLSRLEAKAKIDSFFQKKEFGSEELRKIKRLAMKHRIKLGGYRKSF